MTNHHLRHLRMISLHYSIATNADLPLLAELNRQLILDEGSRNRMTLPELEERMRGWLAGEYTAVLFRLDDVVAAYALYRPEGAGIYLRQFFVVPEQRRNGIGRQAIELLRTQIWPQGCRVTVEVLVQNERAHAFWRAVGFVDYAVTLELL